MAKFDKVIPPGREGKIELAVGGDKVHGEFTKSATVDSNDPDHPHMTLMPNGIWPSSGMPICAASRAAPPLPKIS